MDNDYVLVHKEDLINAIAMGASHGTSGEYRERCRGIAAATVASATDINTRDILALLSTEELIEIRDATFAHRGWDLYEAARDILAEREQHEQSN